MEPIYEARHLGKQYGAKPALLDVTFAVEPGRLVGLLGPNGCGKTTLLKLSAGLLQPTRGEVLICGKAPGVETKALVSYLPDRMALPKGSTTQDLLDFYGDFYTDFDMPKARAMLADLKLDPRQRVGVALQKN